MKTLALFCAMITITTANTDTYLGHVVFSHIIFRHGNRMPLEFYENDPYKDSSNWDFKIQQLTDIGKKQQFELGQWLRLRYKHLLSEHYDPEEIYVQSSDLDRTLMSAQYCMAGLYSQPGHFNQYEMHHQSEYHGQPRFHHRHNSNPVMWELVPVHTMPLHTDPVVVSTPTCPCQAYDVEMERARNLPEVRALEQKFTSLYEYISQHSGNDVKDFEGALKIYDVLAIEEQHNKTLPEWVRPIYPEPIKQAGLYHFVFHTWTTLMKRLKMGPMIKEMVEHFQSKQEGSMTPDRKLWVYSAHDSTISGLLNSFKVFDVHFPPYASCVMLELRFIKGEYFVTLFYRNNTSEEPQLLPIKTCSTVCPLDQFVSLVQPLLPNDWKQECQLPVITSETNLWPSIMTFAGVLTCLTIFSLLALCIRKKRSSKTYLTITPPFINSISNGTSKKRPSLVPSFSCSTHKKF